jgi:hypothetical protein
MDESVGGPMSVVTCRDSQAAAYFQFDGRRVRTAEQVRLVLANTFVGIYPSVSRGMTSLAWCTHSCAELRLRCCDCPVSAHGTKGYLGT